VADKKSDASSCGSYPAPGCSASEYIAAAKVLRELLLLLTVQETKKSWAWKLLWGFDDAKKMYAGALEYAEGMASTFTPNPAGQPRTASVRSVAPGCSGS